MSDNYSSKQTRVLTTDERNLDNVVFLYRTPPLTSEWNLVNQISNQKIQDSMRLSYPSGWLKTGNVPEGAIASDTQSGQVLTSIDFNKNTFKLISNGDNVAIVNGWPLLIQGSNSSDDNNIIVLPEPSGQYYDFVFLEVWRKLVSYDEEVYPYGNVSKSPYTDNEIKWDTLNFESTKRVQIQYRIRVESLTTIVNPTSDVFSDVNIHPIGGRTSGGHTGYSFRVAGAHDAGLFVAGDGSSSSQNSLNTVDGYVYAIPMFVVNRRVKSTGLFGPTTMRCTSVDKEAYMDDTRYDRPDEVLSDVVYASDIIDYRHRIVMSGKDLEDIASKTISSLVAGTLTTAVKKGKDSDGADSMAFSGGSVITKVERLNSAGGDNIPDIGVGSNTTSATFKRRSFSNAELTQDHCIIGLPIPGTTWSNGDTIDLSTLALPAGEIVSVDGFYSPSLLKVSGVSLSGTDVIISDVGSNSIVGTSASLYMEFTFKYASSSYGFKDVPREFLEINKGIYRPMPTRGRDIPVRFNNNLELLNFGLNPNNGETDSRDHLHYCGGNYTESYDFGVELVVYRKTSAGGDVSLTFTDGKYNGYYILGVKSVEDANTGNLLTFTQSRQISISPYTISGYSINASTIASETDVIIRLMVGSKFISAPGESYSLEESIKFFELTKQGMGIIDTYEMIDVIAEYNGSSYVIDTVDKPIIAIGSYKDSSDVSRPIAYKYDNSGLSIAITDTYINQNLPVLDDSSYTDDLLPTRIVIQAATTDSYIRVPVLVHSYVTVSESSYNFYYKTAPYQGLLDTSTEFRGKFQSESKAIITTLGSGSIRNYKYDTGFAIFVNNSKFISGIEDHDGNAPKWSNYAQAGDYIKAYGTKYTYRIKSVVDDLTLELYEKYTGPDVTSTYELSRMDKPYGSMSNIINRLPAKNVSTPVNGEIIAYQCYSDDMQFDNYEGPFILTSPIQKGNDPLNAWANDFKLGDSTSSKRGRNNIILSLSNNPAYMLSESSKPRPDISYSKIAQRLDEGHHKKVYQCYLFNRSGKGYINGEKDQTGRVYLVVLSGEVSYDLQNKLNSFLNIDTVDAFELIGRPIIRCD